MPSRRMIDPAFWQSETVASLDIEHRYLFIGLFSNADDQGRLKGHPALLGSLIFPYDGIDPTTITGGLEALAGAECIYRYDIDGRCYIQILNWWKYQTPQWAYPSNIPAPEGWQDRLRYRKGNKVHTDGWETDGGFLPKDLPKDLPNHTTVKHGTHSSSIVQNSIVVVEDKPTATTTAFDAYLKLTGGAMGPLQGDQLADLIDELDEHRKNLARGSPGADLCGDTWVTEAIKEASASTTERVSLNYIKAILDRWRAEGYKAPRGGKGKEFEEVNAWQ